MDYVLVPLSGNSHSMVQWSNQPCGSEDHAWPCEGGWSNEGQNDKPLMSCPS